MKKQITKLAPKARMERKKRVAAYARVSTGKDAMRHSLAQQISYYTDLIHQDPGWSFAGVYADDAYTGTKDERPEFQRLLADCRNGCVDMIITKSISRFARNTVTLLQTVRDLKSMGIDVYFEEQKIHTLSTDGELMLTILASYAQEESKSASDNMKWRIYRSFMDGMTPIAICHMLESKGILTPGKKKKWLETTVLSILKNEKYKGDALLQKTFTVDFLTKKHKVNEGEVQQYYISGNHEAIIPPAEFEKVQTELARRKTYGRGYSCSGLFASRLICGECGGYYGQKVWHSNDPYRRVIWRCNKKYDNGAKCATPTLSEDAIKGLFLKAYSQLMADRDIIAADCKILADMLGDTAALDEKIASTQKEIDEVIALNNTHIHSYAVSGKDKEAFNKKALEYDERFKKADSRLEKLKADRQTHISRSNAIKDFIKSMMEQTLVLNEWQDQLWNLFVQKAVIQADGAVEFIFKGENTITVRSE